MSNDNASAEIVLPADWGFSSRVNSLVSLPLRRTDAKKIVRRNGDVQVTFTAFGDMMPYGKLPRMLDAIIATMVLTDDESWDGATRRWYLGRSFYEFAEHKLGITRGGSQYKRLRDQVNYWIRTAYTIENKGNPYLDAGQQFLVAEAWHVPWVDMDEWNRHPSDRDCWLQFSEMFIEKVVRENPVPVSFRVLRELNQLKSPLAIDVYLWLNRRMSYLQHPCLVPWDTLREQFGSEAKTLGNFKRTFKESLLHVETAWPELQIAVNDKNGVTLYPSQTVLLTVDQTHAIELEEKEIARTAHAMEQRKKVRDKARRSEVAGKWFSIFGQPDQIWWCSEAWDINKAQNHLYGTVEQEACPVCGYDERNRARHASWA